METYNKSSERMVNILGIRGSTKPENESRTYITISKYINAKFYSNGIGRNIIPMMENMEDYLKTTPYLKIMNKFGIAICEANVLVIATPVCEDKPNPELLALLKYMKTFDREVLAGKDCHIIISGKNANSSNVLIRMIREVEDLGMNIGKIFQEFSEGDEVMLYEYIHERDVIQLGINKP